MRLIAEERRNHTLPLLLSAPVSLTAIVMGKFLGLWLFLCLIAALGGSMALSLYAGGSLDVGLLLVGLLGQMLLAACFAALGLYFSCLTAHPAVAAICGIGAGLGLWLLDFVFKGQDALQALSLLQHFEHINRGFLDSADVLYFLLFTGTFLLLAINRLDSERLCA
jgi:ABC-2 type transport system permease protein